MRFQRFERIYEIVSWAISIGLIALAYLSPSIIDERRPILYLVAAMFGFFSFLLARLMPIEYEGWISYQREDKVLVESLIMILLLTAFMYMNVLPFRNLIFLFLIPIMIEASVMHEKVIMAEAAFAFLAIGFLKLSEAGEGAILTFAFLSDVALFLFVISLMFYLTRRLRMTTEENDRMGEHLSERLDQIQVITQLIRQSEFFSDFDRLLLRIAEITADAFDAEQCGFFLPGDDGRIALHPSSVGFREQDRRVFSVDDNLRKLEAILGEKEPVVYNQGPAEKDGLSDLVGAKHLKNYVIMTMRIHDSNLGLMMLTNKRSGGFGRSDVNFLRILMGFIATLIDSANSFRRVASERRAAERMTKLLVGRELRMKELKEKLKNGKTHD